MRVIFLADRTCALTVNGVYLGLVDGFERTCELNPEERVFCELQASGCAPLSFLLDETFLLDPPPQIKLYYYAGGVAVYAGDFLSADASLQVIKQTRLGGTLITLYRQGKLQLNVENETGFHLIELPAMLNDGEIYAIGEDFLIEGETAFALISHDGTLWVLSEGRIIEKETVLKAEVPFHDCLGHTAVCTWERDKLIDCAVRTTHEPTEMTFALALFESVLIGAEFTAFLHESLIERAQVLREYLGEFQSVVLTQEPNRIGLVYRRKERIFDVRYYRVELTDGKISNISSD